MSLLENEIRSMEILLKLHDSEMGDLEILAERIFISFFRVSRACVRFHFVPGLVGDA